MSQYRIYQNLPEGTFYVERCQGDSVFKRLAWCDGFRAALAPEDFHDPGRPYSCKTLDQAVAFVANAKHFEIEDAKPKFKLVMEL